MDNYIGILKRGESFVCRVRKTSTIQRRWNNFSNGTPLHQFTPRYYYSLIFVPLNPLSSTISHSCSCFNGERSILSRILCNCFLGSFPWIGDLLGSVCQYARNIALSITIRKGREEWQKIEKIHWRSGRETVLERLTFSRLGIEWFDQPWTWRVWNYHYYLPPLLPSHHAPSFFYHEWIRKNGSLTIGCFSGQESQLRRQLKLHIVTRTLHSDRSFDLRWQFSRVYDAINRFTTDGYDHPLIRIRISCVVPRVFSTI